MCAFVHISDKVFAKCAFIGFVDTQITNASKQNARRLVQVCA